MTEELLTRRREIIEEMAQGRIEPAHAAALIERDARRLARAASRSARAWGPRRARWLWIKVRPEGWSRRISFPLPLGLVRTVMRVAGKRAAGGFLQAGPVDLDWRELCEMLDSLPRCGCLVRVEDGPQQVEVWLT